MSTITIQKDAGGAVFWIQKQGFVNRPYTVNDYEFQPYEDGISYSLVSKDQLIYIVTGAKYTDTINGDTGDAFATFAALQSYIITNFFRKAGGAGSGSQSANYISGEIPVGTVNGSNTSYTIAHTPLSGSLSVFLNGIFQRPTLDWSVSGTTLTMVVAPPIGYNLLITYQY